MKKLNLSLSLFIFASCLHAQTVNLRVDKLNTFTPITPMTFSVAGVEAARYSTDKFYQVTASYTGTNKCAIGTIGIRNNAGQFQICQNADGWNTISAGGSSGISGAGNAGYLVMYTATTGVGNSLLFQTNGGPAGQSVVVNATTTDIVVVAPQIFTIGDTSGFVAAGATSNASYAHIYIQNSNAVSFASQRSGSGTFLRMQFETSEQERMRIAATGEVMISGNLRIGDTTTPLSPLELTSATSNASTLIINPKDAVGDASILARRTGTGSFNNITLDANASRFTINQGIGQFNFLAPDNVSIITQLSFYPSNGVSAARHGNIQSNFDGTQYWNTDSGGYITLSGTSKANFGINTSSYGTSSVGVFAIGVATTIPTGNPVNSFTIFMDPADNKLKARGPSGTVTTIANP